MPGPQTPGTNQYRCGACGRHLNSEQELENHQRECAAALRSGSPSPKVAGKEEDGEDRDWVSTP